MSIRLSSLRALVYETQINGLGILNKTVNDFSLWRLIEYPRVTHILEASPGDLVLDIGAGTSSYPLMLAKKGARVVAVDLEPARAEWQHARATSLKLPVQPVVADATALPFAANSFSRITSISAIEHIPDDRAVGQEVARVLHPGGIAAISVPYTFGERQHFFRGLKPFQRVARNEFIQAGRGNLVRFYTDGDLEARFAQPMQSRIESKTFFGRSLLNNHYHETRLNRYWTRLILKDLILKWFVHPFEEIFLRNSEPFDVIFRLRKSPRG